MDALYLNEQMGRKSYSRYQLLTDDNMDNSHVTVNSPRASYSDQLGKGTSVRGELCKTTVWSTNARQTQLPLDPAGLTDGGEVVRVLIHHHSQN